MNQKAFVTEILRIAAGELALMGMRKSGGIHTYRLGADAFGWLGLNTITHRADGRVGLNPIAGVRHVGIEKLLEQLSGKDRFQLNPTISTAIGYLMPEHRYVEWLFEPGPFDYVTECKTMVMAVKMYGIPFMESNTSLLPIINHLEQYRFTTREAATYRLPIAYWLAKQYELATAYIENRMSEIDNRQDVAAQDYRNFASNFFRMK
jgi:hypothetical protein